MWQYMCAFMKALGGLRLKPLKVTSSGDEAKVISESVLCFFTPSFKKCLICDRGNEIYLSAYLLISFNDELLLHTYCI